MPSSHQTKSSLTFTSFYVSCPAQTCNSIPVILYSSDYTKRVQLVKTSLLWIYEYLFGCHHRHLSRVFTIRRRTYQTCVECGREFDRNPFFPL
jgi:hypothetical protein